MKRINFSRLPISLDLSRDIFIHPSNSCYGMGACIHDQLAYERIYDLKKRQKSKPFFVTFPGIASVENFGFDTRRMQEYMSLYPHTIFTFVVERNENIPTYINPHHETLWIQIASGPLLKIFEYISTPIFGTSANIAGEESIYSSEEICEEFGDVDDLIFLDAWDLEKRPPSTIIDLTQSEPSILRWTLDSWQTSS